MKLGKEQFPEGVEGKMHYVVEGGVVGGAKEDRPAQDLDVDRADCDVSLYAK